MLEYSILQTRGFANTTEGDRVTGFQVTVRMPNYRGAWGSLVDGANITVDGRSFPTEEQSWTIAGRTFTLPELQRSEGVHWDLQEPAVVSVPLEGGLTPGVHDVSVEVMTRSPYIPAFALPLRFPDRRELTVVPVGTGDDAGFKYGVSIYSLAQDINTLMTFEDAVADSADLGATGIELLTQGIPGYPTPSTAWIDEWHRLLDTYQVQATNISSWIDNQMWRDRDLTVDEASEQLARDLRLAHTLGFSYLRPKFGVVSPQLDPHPTWEETVLRNLDLAAELDVVINPEIHSPTPIQHPVTQNYIAFIERTGTEHFKLLIDTGIFQTELVTDGHTGFSEDEVPEFLRPLRTPMSDLAEVLPHVGFIQSKFFEVDNTLTDLHVPWQPILQTLHDGGWSGWLSAEYEGRREPGRGREQIRRHHALLRGLAADLGPRRPSSAS